MPLNSVLMASIEQLIRDEQGRPRLILLGVLAVAAGGLLFLMEHWKDDAEKSYLLGGMLPVEGFGLFAVALGAFAIVVGLVKKLRR